MTSPRSESDDIAPDTRRTETLLPDAEREQQETRQLLLLNAERSKDAMAAAIRAEQASNAAKSAAIEAKREAAACRIEQQKGAVETFRQFKDNRNTLAEHGTQIAGLRADVLSIKATLEGDVRRRAQSFDNLGADAAAARIIVEKERELVAVRVEHERQIAAVRLEEAAAAADREERITHLEKRRAVYRGVVIVLGILATAAGVIAAAIGAH